MTGLIRAYGCLHVKVPRFVTVLIPGLPLFIFLSKADILLLFRIIHFMHFFYSFLTEMMIKITLLHVRMLLLDLLNSLRHNRLQDTLLDVDPTAHNAALIKKSANNIGRMR
jgi:hypothetical protein